MGLFGNKNAGTTANNQGGMMRTLEKILATIASLAAFLALAGWVIALIGVALLQKNCNGNGVTDCSDAYGIEWWGLALELFVILACIFVAWVPALRRHRPAIVALLAISSVLAMFFIDIFRGLRRLSNGTTHKRHSLAMAGFIIYTIANLLLILSLGVDTADHTDDNRVHNHGANTGGQQYGTNTGGVGNQTVYREGNAPHLATQV